MAGTLVFAALLLFLGSQTVQATCVFTGSLSSSTIPQGTASVTVRGTDDCGASSPGDVVNVYLDAGICGSGGRQISSFATTTNSSHGFSQNIPTSSLGQGSYCVVLTTCTASPNCGSLKTISDPLTVGAAIQLMAGWNLISLPVVPVNSAIASVLGPILANVTMVWSYSAATKTWSYFKPGPPASGSLTTMTDGNGYWISMTKSDVLYVNGTVIPPTSAPATYRLSAGWNLVGFKPQPDPTVSETLSTYLSSISGDYSAVWLYDNPTGTWIRATSSTSIPVGEALWVYVTIPNTLRP